MENVQISQIYILCITVANGILECGGGEMVAMDYWFVLNTPSPGALELPRPLPGPQGVVRIFLQLAKLGGCQFYDEGGGLWLIVPQFMITDLKLYSDVQKRIHILFLLYIFITQALTHAEKST